MGPWFRCHRSTVSVPTFYYHSVGGLPPQTLATEVFAEHLAILRRLGVRGVALGDLASGRYTAADRVVGLCFDDGLRDNATIVAPLLSDQGHRGTFFVVPGHDGLTRWVNPSTGAWSDERRPGYTQPHPCMTGEERRGVAEAGHEIGGHGWTHRPLTQLSDDELDDELGRSRRHLEATLDRSVTTLSYPYGRVSPRVVRAARRAGYTSGWTTMPGYAACAVGNFLRPRFLVEDPTYFEAVVRGAALHPRPIVSLLWRHLMLRVG